MAPTRIPERGDPRRPLYFAEKALLSNLRVLQESVDAIVNNPNAYGDVGLYSGTLSAVKLALTLAEAAWQKGQA